MSTSNSQALDSNKRFLNMTYGEVFKEDSVESRAFLKRRNLDPGSFFITMDLHRNRRVPIKTWDRWHRFGSYKLQKFLKAYIPDHPPCPSSPITPQSPSTE